LILIRDGYLDFIDIGSHAALISSDGKWDVYFGKGEFVFGEKHEWSVPDIELLLDGRGFSIDDSNHRHLKKSIVASLQDINGDNLADLVVQTKDKKLKTFSTMVRDSVTLHSFLDCEHHLKKSRLITLRLALQASRMEIAVICAVCLMSTEMG